MVKANNTQVTISAAMLNCIKQLIFSQTDGVDLTPIVEDLGGEDTTAIAVALAYKGIKPEIDTNTRFDSEYINTYAKYIFKSYSIIKDNVLVGKTLITWNEETRHWDFSDEREISISLYRWLTMSTSPEECIAKINKNLGIEKESKTVLRTSPKN